jgi:hypothetical protein
VPDFVAPQLDRCFYDELPCLAHVRRGAEARRCAPNAVLVAVLCRVAALVTPEHRLTTARPISLNLCGGLVAPSGVGKSSAWQAARALLPDLGLRVLDGRGLGSGEGLIDAYLGTARKVSKRDDHETYERPRVADGAAFYVDEGETMIRLGLRQGSTLLQHLRTAWSGYALSVTNANGDTNRHLADFSYAFSVCASFQATAGGVFLADAEGGTPQRFLFASAQDREMPDVPPSWPGPFAFGSHDVLGIATALGVDREIEREIDARHVAKHHGTSEDEALDSHGDAIRLRVAGLLAVLDALTSGSKRVFVGPREWTLAGHVTRNSAKIRQAVEAYGEAAKSEKREERARERNAEDAIRDDLAEQRLLDRVVENFTNLVLKAWDGKLRDPNYDGPTTGAVWNAMAARDRHKVSPVDVEAKLKEREHVAPYTDGRGKKRWAPRIVARERTRPAA